MKLEIGAQEPLWNRDLDQAIHTAQEQDALIDKKAME